MAATPSPAPYQFGHSEPDDPPPWAGVTEGRIVHYRHSQLDRCQPAIVVRHWGGGTVQLQVFRDGSNDRADGWGDSATYWATSVAHGDGASLWHWPERV